MAGDITGTLRAGNPDFKNKVKSGGESELEMQANASLVCHARLMSGLT